MRNKTKCGLMVRQKRDRFGLPGGSPLSAAWPELPLIATPHTSTGTQREMGSRELRCPRLFREDRARAGLGFPVVTEEALMEGRETGDTPCKTGVEDEKQKKGLPQRQLRPTQPPSLRSLPDQWQSKFGLVPLSDGELLHSKISPCELGELSTARNLYILELVLSLCL